MYSIAHSCRWQPRPLQSSNRLDRRSVWVRCAQSGGIGDVSSHSTPHVSSTESKPGFLRGVRELFAPFQDKHANVRFFALALGGLLCSVATLIHDSYLPIFMKNELGMTNTVRQNPLLYLSQWRRGICNSNRDNLGMPWQLDYPSDQVKDGRCKHSINTPWCARLQSIGSVQALSQLLCQISKSFSGVLGDVLGSQVKILVFGTALTAACKPLFAASSLVFASFGVGACLWCITVGKMMDRVSKGFREAPTKVLISQTARDVGENADAAFSALSQVRQVMRCAKRLLCVAAADQTCNAQSESPAGTVGKQLLCNAAGWTCACRRAAVAGNSGGPDRQRHRLCRLCAERPELCRHVRGSGCAPFHCFDVARGHVPQRPAGEGRQQGRGRLADTRAGGTKGGCQPREGEGDQAQLARQGQGAGAGVPARVLAGAHRGVRALLWALRLCVGHAARSSSAPRDIAVDACGAVNRRVAQNVPATSVQRYGGPVMRFTSYALLTLQEVAPALCMSLQDSPQQTASSVQVMVPKAMLPILGSTTMLATSFTAFMTGHYTKGKGVAVRNKLLVCGFLVLLAANALLAAPSSANIPGIFTACVCVGVHMGMTQGLTLSMLSSYMPQDRVPGAPPRLPRSGRVATLRGGVARACMYLALPCCRRTTQRMLLQAPARRMYAGLGMVGGTAWSFNDVVLGCILAASNQLAGKLTDLTVARSMGNIGCFGGGAAAALFATLLLLLFMRFGDLGKELPRKSKVKQ
jgi:hypothetical protein